MIWEITKRIGKNHAGYEGVGFNKVFDAIKIKMEEEGLKRKDLIGYFGSASRVSEVLNRKDHLHCT